MRETKNRLLMRIHYFWLTKVMRQNAPTSEQMRKVLITAYPPYLVSSYCIRVANDYRSSFRGDLRRAAAFHRISTERLRQVLWKVWRTQYYPNGYIKRYW